MSDSTGQTSATPQITEEMIAAGIEAAKADSEIRTMAGRGAGVFHALPSIVEVALRAALAGRADIEPPPEPEKREAYDAAALNALSETLTQLYGFLPLNVRYGAAAAALRHVNESGYSDPYTTNDDGSDEYARMVNESGAASGFSENGDTQTGGGS